MWPVSSAFRMSYVRRKDTTSAAAGFLCLLPAHFQGQALKARVPVLREHLHGCTHFFTHPPVKLPEARQATKLEAGFEIPQAEEEASHASARASHVKAAAGSART